MSHVLEINNVLRPDVVASSLDKNAVLANAPHNAQGHFVVPKVIE